MVFLNGIIIILSHIATKKNKRENVSITLSCTMLKKKINQYMCLDRKAIFKIPFYANLIGVKIIITFEEKLL